MRERDHHKDHAHKHQSPTAGPAADDRYGAGRVASNLETRILAVHVVEGRTRITIACGKNWGIHTAMEGYVRAGLSMLADFQIDQVELHRCHAFVDVTPDQLKSAQRVVINPTSKPGASASAETPARVIGVWVEQRQTKVILSHGFAHGIRFRGRGELRSANGHALSFVIDGVTANQSFAIVTGTVDEVNAHPQVVLFSPGTNTPIQRRATGGAPAADVQATASAGVASASSALPHLDAIQRSFGKHDVSSIRAQVGGAATSATNELGAQAYATGDRVAFASTPDLHTAAHEAAHVIQQQRGAVGFQGLGAADDEHERHADAVADAVVAGKSAEPLLDQLTGNGVSGAVQRKQATAMSPHDHTRLVDLLVQQATQAALEAQRADHSPVLLANAETAVSRMKLAIDTMAMQPFAPADAKKAFVSVDAAYSALDALHKKMRNHTSISKHAASVADVRDALAGQFQRFGWKVPSSPKEALSRARLADSLGATSVDSAEDQSLTLLHARAARETLVATWPEIARGESGQLSSVALHLREATAHVRPDSKTPDSLRIELTKTEAIFERVLLVIEQQPPPSLGTFIEIAGLLDVLRSLTAQQPKWKERLHKKAPPHTPTDIVSGGHLGTDAPKNEIAGIAVDPLVKQGGTKCDVDEGDGCFVSKPQRSALLANYKQRVDDAQKEFHAAVAELRVDLLLAEEKDEDVSWAVSLLLDVLSVFVVGKLAIAVQGMRTAGIAGLDAMIAENYRQNLSTDPKWKIRAANLLEKISDKQIEAQVKAGVGAVKGAARKQLADVDQARAKRGDAKKKDIAFLDAFRVQANLAFNKLKEDVPAPLNDVELLAMYSAFAPRDHQKEPYRVAVESKLQQFRASGVKKIGRRYEDASDARRVVRDVRVVWYTYASGRQMELVFERQDGYREARDHYRKPGPVPVSHDLRDVVQTPGRPDVAPRRIFGANRPLADAPSDGVSDQAGSPRVVPKDLEEVAVALNQEAWGEAPRVVFIDDRK